MEMNHKVNRRRLTRSAAVSIPLACLALLTTPAGAAAANPSDTAANDVTQPYKCQVNTTQGLPYARGFTGTAPDTVAVGHKFTAEIDPAPITPNPVHNTYAHDLTLTFQLPGNATLIGYKLTGGDTPTTSYVTGGTLVLQAPGPFPAGVAFDLPTVQLRLKATHSGVVTTTAGGTGYEDYGFGWDFIPSASEGGGPGTLRCYPDPVAALTSTTVES